MTFSPSSTHFRHLSRAECFLILYHALHQGPAAQSALRVNDVLLEIDGRDASSLEALVCALCRGTSGSVLQLRVQSPGQQGPPREVVLKRGGASSEAASRHNSGKENAKANCSPCVPVDAAASCQDERPAAALHCELEALQNALREAKDKLAERDAELDALRARLARQELERNWAAIDRCDRCRVASCARLPSLSMKAVLIVFPPFC